MNTKMKPEQEAAVDAAVARLEAIGRDEGADLVALLSTHANQIVAAELLLARDDREAAEQACQHLKAWEMATSRSAEDFGQAAEVASWLATNLAVDRGVAADD